ncbi:MAG: ATP-binding protein [Tissierellia bacterium]|nr:ATP-binding protein [Tissierellia bacterium]
MEYRFCGSVLSDMKMIRNFVRDRILEIDDYIDDKEKLCTIKLILNELVINGAIHGNRLDEVKNVSLMLIIDKDKIYIRVKDEGAGIKYDPNSYNPNELLSDGRGLILVSNLADRLIMNENIITAIMNLGR